MHTRNVLPACKTRITELMNQQDSPISHQRLLDGFVHVTYRNLRFKNVRGKNVERRKCARCEVKFLIRVSRKRWLNVVRHCHARQRTLHVQLRKKRTRESKQNRTKTTWINRNRNEEEALKEEEEFQTSKFNRINFATRFKNQNKPLSK